jgi:hypothetical protein
MVGVRMIAADNIKPLGARSTIGAHILTRVEIKAIGQRMLVLCVGQANLSAPVIRRLVNRLDQFLLAFDAPNQQPHALIRVACLGVLRNRLTRGFRKYDHCMSHIAGYRSQAALFRQPMTSDLSNPFTILAQSFRIPEAVAEILGRPIAENRHHYTLLQLPSHAQRSRDIGGG